MHSQGIFQNIVSVLLHLHSFIYIQSYSQSVCVRSDVIKHVGNSYLVLVSYRGHPGVILSTEHLLRSNKVQVACKTQLLQNEHWLPVNQIQTLVTRGWFSSILFLITWVGEKAYRLKPMVWDDDQIPQKEKRSDHHNSAWLFVIHSDIYTCTFKSLNFFFNVMPIFLTTTRDLANWTWCYLKKKISKDTPL